MDEIATRKGKTKSKYFTFESRICLIIIYLLNNFIKI